MSNYAESWLKFEEGVGTRPILSGTPEEMRTAHAALMSALKPQYPPNPVSVTIHEGSHDTFGYRVYRPSSSNDAQLMPVGIYYHPGGLVVGPSIADEYFCAAVAEKNQTVIVAISYRLSPENKAPAHIEDALKGAEWVFNNAATFGGDPSKIYVVGVSAGGGLSVSVTRKILLGQTPLDPKIIKGVAAFCPVLLHPDNIPSNYQSLHKSSIDNKTNTPIVDGESLRVFIGLAGQRPDDPDYFPALDGDSHKNFPPTYLVSCEMDSLRDDVTVFETSLRAAGVSVKSDSYPGLPHCFWIVPYFPETEKFMEQSYAGIQWVIDQI
ncbi:unnamed protein product [Clonostachys rosea]|uniref:Alpha/beta hydrolase fold-3 domain-containing protein n=1 Tax=Bionectria ochroleuca TaxID=29856 RepID=A0ABY6U8G8_BIOOC|nr:unnamed protein product [Clonostachys rosea]